MIDLINVANAGVITDAPSFQSIGIKVLNFLLSVAGIVAIIMLVISGMIYFLSFGDESKMQKAKNSAKFSIVGIIIIMGAMIIVRLIGQFFN